MARIIHIIRMYINLFRIASNPKNTEAGLAIAEQLEALGLLETENAMIISDPDSAKFTKKRKLMGRVDLHALNLLPEGNLGKVYPRRYDRAKWFEDKRLATQYSSS